VTYGSGYTSYYAPTTTYYAAPTTTYYSAPVTSYYAPYTTYSPVTTYYAPGVVGSTIYGTPQVYVPGQPVRNLLRSVIP
jgi:hypothetical protein